MAARGNLYTFIDLYGGFRRSATRTRSTRAQAAPSEEGRALDGVDKAALDGLCASEADQRRVPRVRVSCPPDKWSAAAESAPARGGQMHVDEEGGEKCRSKCKTTCGECA